MQIKKIMHIWSKSMNSAKMMHKYEPNKKWQKLKNMHMIQIKNDKNMHIWSKEMKYYAYDPNGNRVCESQ